MPRINQPMWTLNSAAWVIFDLDGTLADITHRLHHIQQEGLPKDWPAFNAACESDDPKHEVIELLKMVREYGKQIAIFSGRDEAVKRKTEEWLQYHSIYYDLLVMRPAKDYRPDVEIKKEMFDKYFTPKDIWFVTDDRDQVVKFWRSLGLTCFQVQKGDY